MSETERHGDELGEGVQSWFGDASVLPVCALRVTIGAILLFWYLDLLPDVELLFSETGLFPHEVLYREKSWYLLSLLDWVPGDWGPGAFIFFGIISSLFLLVGRYSRVAALASFFCLLSVQNRNILPWDGSDAVIRVVCFWLIFCPIERAYSLDAWRASRRGRPYSLYAPALGVRLLQLQIASVYFVTGWAKLHGLSWLNGTALHYALNLGPAWTRFFASDFANNKYIVIAGTVGTLLLELLFTPLVFSPWLQPRLKTVALVWGALFHLLIALTLRVSWFSYVMVGSYLIFFEPEWIRRIESFVRRRAKRLFDHSHLLQRSRVGPLLNTVPSSLALPNDAVKPFVSSSASIIKKGLRITFDTLLITLFMVSFWYSIEPTSKAIRKAAPVPTAVRASVQAVGLGQSWRMFSPEPYSFASYVVLEGALDDGKEINLLKSGYGQGG